MVLPTATETSHCNEVTLIPAGDLSGVAGPLPLWHLAVNAIFRDGPVTGTIVGTDRNYTLIELVQGPRRAVFHEYTEEGPKTVTDVLRHGILAVADLREAARTLHISEERVEEGLWCSVRNPRPTQETVPDFLKRAWFINQRTRSALVALIGADKVTLVMEVMDEINAVTHP